VEATEKNPYARQIVVSLLVAILIIAAAIAVVTARLGSYGGVEGERRERERREDNSGSGSDNSGHGSFGGEAIVRFAAGKALRL
jgi:flagellar basal body-associated protein FliL